MRVHARVTSLPLPIYTPGLNEALWEFSVLPMNTTQWVLSIIPQIPEFSVGIQMEKSVSVSSDRNIRDHLWRWSTYFGPKFVVPFLTNRLFALIRELRRETNSGKSHSYWLARFNRKMLFHFARKFPLISDRSVSHNGKHPITQPGFQPGQTARFQRTEHQATARATAYFTKCEVAFPLNWM